MTTREPITREQEQRAYDDVRQMAEQAEEVAERGQTPRCINGEPVFYYEWDRSLVPGHIHSPNGIDEVRISKACEYHFDQWFGGEEESPELWDEETQSVVGPRFGVGQEVPENG